MKKVFLKLGKQPITNSFLTMDELSDEYTYDLSIVFDNETKLVSLLDTVKPSEMFNEVYAHRASQSKTMRESFKSIALKLVDEFNPNKVLEIGSNDGVFIGNFDYKKVISVEPCSNLAELTIDMGYKTYPEFWSRKLSSKIVKNHGCFDIIYSANTISHIEDLDEVFQGVKISLSDKGVFVFEDPSIYSVMKNVSYDQFYDEHVHLFSVISLNNILQKNGLTIFRVDNLAVHGGSNRIYVKHLSCNKYFPVENSVDDNIRKETNFGLEEYKTYQFFSKKVEKSKEDLVILLKKLKNKGKKIISYGATYKSTTIFNYCGVGTNFIDYVTDTTQNKQGKLTPGMRIPIISPESGFNDTVDYAFLGAWNFKNEILKKENKFIKRGGRFITHVPYVHIIED
jgi:methylation protein EvaC